MQLALTQQEARLLLHCLTQQIEHMDEELVHTDKRQLQRELAEELKAVRALTDRIRRSAISDEQVAPTV